MKQIWLKWQAVVPNFPGVANVTPQCIEQQTGQRVQRRGEGEGGIDL